MKQIILIVAVVLVVLYLLGLFTGFGGVSIHLLWAVFLVLGILYFAQRV